MWKRILGTVVFIISLNISSQAFAQSPHISSGLTWLYSAQTSTGYWPEVVTTEYYSTATAIDAGYSLDPTNAAYVSAIQWLTGQLISPTDYLSRQIISLKHAGQDTSGYVSNLLLYRNSDGGFGGAADCPNSYLLDTALALQALKAADNSDITVLYQAVNFLTTSQNPDGGWGVLPGDGSNAYITAITLRALSSYNSLFLLQDPINKTSSYLLTKQNADGGFGSSQSIVYETALSIMSLIESGNGSTQAILNGLNYLSSSQLANGSWNDDPYSTALALQALAAARPNLMVSSIALSKPMPRDGEETTITATVKNSGYDTASNVLVRFYLGDPNAGGTQIGTDQTISSLTPNSSTPLSVTAAFSGTGNKTIFVVADPENQISETSKIDNKSSTRIWVATAPDLAIFSEDLKPSTYTPSSGTAFTLEYKVRNLGESAADAFTVSLYDGDPSTGSGHLLTTANVSGLLGMESRSLSFGVTLSGRGAHTLYVVADAGSMIQELSETNNTGTVTIQVDGAQGMADLVVTSSDITLTPYRPHAGDTVQIAAKVRNQGTEAASNFTVEIFDGAPESGGMLIRSQIVSIASGTNQTISTNWTITSGIHDIYVIADRMNSIVESDENNNVAFTRIMADMVDISISATDLVFTPSHPVNNDTVVLSITAHNTGIKQTGAFNLALYDGDPASGGALLQTFPISNIAADNKSTVSYPFTAIPWTYRFYAIADTENVVTEMYEDNNLAIRSLKVKAPGEILGPDLVPISIDLTSVATDPLTLAISGKAHVNFQNKGDDKITSSFNVILFEDTDLDGRYTPGLDNILSSATNTLPIWPESASMVTMTLSGTVKFLHAPIYALIDSSDAIREQNENNNLMRSCDTCENRPANPIQPLLKFWVAGDQSIRKQPVIAALQDTNGDGRIDDKDITDIIFTSFVLGKYDTALLGAVRGDTGQTVFSINNPSHPIYAGDPAFSAVADIDNDGLPEIVVPRSGGGLVVYNNDGTLKWDNNAQVAAWNQTHSYYMTIQDYSSSAPVIADMDADGSPEIIVGGTIFNADGTVRSTINWHPGAYIGQGIFYGGVRTSTIVDLGLDGNKKIVAGNAAYNIDGTVLWWNTSLPDGPTAIGNFNDDSYPRIALVDGSYGGNLFLLDHNGKVVWGPVNVRTLEPDYQVNRSPDGPPLIADFDGDGENEIGVRGQNKYFVLDKNGILKHTYTLNTGAWWDNNANGTVFDLNGDGKPEFLISTNGYFSIFDGKSGTLLYQEAIGSCGGGCLQNVIIADVNGDNHAEVVVSSGSGLRVYGSKNADWVGARKVWNQHDYHVTNVNDDNTIPQFEAPSWLMNNTFRSQARVGESSNPYLTPNLTASYLRVQQDSSTLTIIVRVGNGGAVDTPPGADVAFYHDSPSSTTLLGHALTTVTLRPGEYQDVSYSAGSAFAGLASVTAVVDPMKVISECSKDDNQASFLLTASTGLPDLTISPEDISVSSGPHYEGTSVPIVVTVRNVGFFPAANVSLRLYDGNPMAGGTQLGTAQTLSSIPATGSATASFTFDTLGRSGLNVLYVVVDSENSIPETNEGNNSAFFTISIEPPILPNLVITTSDVQIAPTSAREGDRITVAARITNRGASTGNILVTLSLGNPSTGGQTIPQTIYPILALGESTSIQAVFETTGHAGQQTIFVEIDPGNTIAESNESDNTATIPVIIQPAGVTSALALDKTSYQADSDVRMSISLANYNVEPWSGASTVNIEDAAGNVVVQAGTLSVQDMATQWSYRIPATLTSTKLIKDALAATTLDFTAILNTLGITATTIDQNSLRIYETSSTGDLLGEKQAKVSFTSATHATVIWLVDGLTLANTQRYFALYFDTADHGQKPLSTNTKLPNTSKLMAFVTEEGTVYTATGNGDGTFGPAVLVDDLTTATDSTRGIVLDDFDGDGFSDIISGSGYTGKLYFYRNKADGSNTFNQKVEIGSITTAGTLMDMAVADFNKDGHQDFVVSGHSNLLYLFKGAGDGTFVSSIIPAPSGSIYFRGKSAADIDGDGNIDLIAGSYANGAIYMYSGLGDGTFKTPVQIGTVGTNPYGVTTGDFDENGKIDIIVHKAASNDTYLLRGDGAGNFSSPTLVSSLPMSNNAAGFDCGDFNNDGHLDIVAAVQTRDSIEYYPGNGNGTFGARTTIATLSSFALGISAAPALAEVRPVLGMPMAVPMRTFPFTWNTGNTASGQYQVHITLSTGAGVVAENRVSFEILPDTRADAKVVTNKISYNPNETAEITSTFASQSVNAVLGNLTAEIVVAGAMGQGSGSELFTDTKTITTLMPGASFTFKSYWNIGTNAAGTYPVTLTLRDSTGTIIATGNQTLTINGSFNPASMLKGRVTVDTQELLSGQTATVIYNVTNIGNSDLQNMTLTVLTVNASDQTVYDAFPYPTTLAMGAYASNSVQIDTAWYTAKDYLVILRANINGTESTLAGTYFRIEGAPSALSLAGPGIGADVLTLTPLLSVNNASDPNDDKLSYEFELYSDSALTQLVATSGLLTPGTGITSWTLPQALIENKTYFWRARAYDNWLYGPWMNPAFFRVNTANDPPTAPLISSPAAGNEISVSKPMLVVTNATDPDSTSLTYNFDVTLDPEFTQIVASTLGVASGQGAASWQIPVNLSENTWYYWRAQADDWLITGPWSTTGNFFVNTSNEAPTMPAIQTPMNGSTVASLDADVEITNSIDPDSPANTYFFELDTVATFDSLNIIRSGGVAEGQGTTTWHVIGLKEDTQYYVRSKASDGQAESSWSSTVGFFANAVNEPPSTPILANPSNGSGVNVFFPTLSVHDAVDPDRDALTYDFEVYSDAGLTTLVTSTTRFAETTQITAWSTPLALTENQIYYWRSRSNDGELFSAWTPQASFMVNTANDAPSAPTLSAPANASTVATLTPVLAVVNAIDPDSPSLTYDFEVYGNSTLVTAISGVVESSSGITSVTISSLLSDNTVYQWRSRAFDGNLYGPWTNMASFTVHLTQTGITAEIEFEPETLNKKSEGNWVKVKIELPHGFKASDIDISSIRLEGIVRAEPSPFEITGSLKEHGCEYDHSSHEHSVLTVKFNRSSVIAVLSSGAQVPVHVTGMVGSTLFEGVDVIRVIK